MESKAAEASGKSAEQRRLERRQKAVIGKIYKKLLVRFTKKLLVRFTKNYWKDLQKIIGKIYKKLFV